MRKKEIKEGMENQKRTPGMPCPECGFFIETSIYTLLSQSEIKCPGCLLTVKLERDESRSALELLQKINSEAEASEKHKKFDV